MKIITMGYWVIGCYVFVQLPAFAIYKCQDANGNVTFSQSECVGEGEPIRLLGIEYGVKEQNSLSERLRKVDDNKKGTKKRKVKKKAPQKDSIVIKFCESAPLSLACKTAKDLLKNGLTLRNLEKVRRNLKRGKRGWSGDQYLSISKKGGIRYRDRQKNLNQSISADKGATDVGAIQNR